MIIRSPEWLRDWFDFEICTGVDIRGVPSQREQARARQKAAEQQARAKEDEVTRDLDNIFADLVRDFSRYPYSDKISTPRINGETVFHYRFEDGSTFKLEGNKLFYHSYVYTVGRVTRHRFVGLVNEITEKAYSRPRSSNYNSSSSNQSRGSRAQSTTKSKWSDHPKGEMYQSLLDNIKLREEQLRRMRPGSEKDALQNELDNAKQAKMRMDARYKFNG